MAAFNFNRPTPSVNLGGLSGLVDRAAQSPLNAIGKKMTELDAIVTQRGKEKYSSDFSQQLKDATTTEGILGLGFDPTRATKAQQDAYNKQLTSVGGLESLQQLQASQAPTIQSNQFKADLQQSALQQLQDDAAAKAGQFFPVSDAPASEFTELSLVDRINAEKTLGQTGTFDLLKQEDARKAAYEKANSPARRDRLQQSEASFYASNPSPTAEERRKFYADWTLQDLGGKSSVKDETDIIEIVNAKNMGKSIISGKDKTDYTTRAGTEAAYKQTDAYTTQVEKAEASFYQADNTIKSTTALATALKTAINSGNFDSGMMASLQKNIGNLGSEGFWRSLSGKSTEQIMSQAGLEGSIGIEVAERLRDMSGLAASDNEFGRTLAQVVGGDWTQEDVKLSVLNNFIEKITAKNKRVGERLVRNGLVGDVADVYNRYGKKPDDTTNVVKVDTPTPVGMKKQFNRDTGEYRFVEERK